ncbi:Pleckstrin (PH) and lipid-binding START domains-containing protein isoform 2 [Hibiscus syriacus]|uniref:Pleckstrin (PH) and lipid-binding START domains-containing protein isoform 2 n=1 Tax=Hibiscus syriacus TaxID=106335 RepID=A0A6A2YZN1_HIBSY|nr:Pleckstrin (PH) and lipid-binding START domains-containing protein isoform 2 [Hibiscus syriacus]
MAEDSSCCQHWNDHPAIMAVGMVDETSEAIFLALMSLGPSRSEWDFCVYQGSVVECLEEHTDIIHKKLYSDWLPWNVGFEPNVPLSVLVVVILYHSMVHEKCPPQSGYVLALLKNFVLCFERFVLQKSIGRGYVITPVNRGQQSTVKRMLSIDWKFWKFYVRPSAARSLTISMLKRVAALRELFKGKQGNYSSKCLSREWLRHIHLPRTEKIDNNIDTESAEKIEEDDLIENEENRHRLSSKEGLHGLTRGGQGRRPSLLLWKLTPKGPDLNFTLQLVGRQFVVVLESWDLLPMSNMNTSMMVVRELEE